MQKLLAAAIQAPPWGPATDPDTRLEIAVVFTSVESTLRALKRASALAARLNARIKLVVPQVVPYPLPLASPPVQLDFNERRFRVIASVIPIETTVRVYLCRDPDTLLCAVLKPHSIVVIGDRGRWWPTAEKRLAGKLRRAGHEVILAETDYKSHQGEKCWI